MPLNSDVVIVDSHASVHMTLLLSLDEYRHRHTGIVTADCHVVDRSLSRKHREKVVYFLFMHIAMSTAVSDPLNQPFESSDMLAVASCYDAQHV